MTMGGAIITTVIVFVAVVIIIIVVVIAIVILVDCARGPLGGRVWLGGGCCRGLRGSRDGGRVLVEMVRMGVGLIMGGIAEELGDGRVCLRPLLLQDEMDRVMFGHGVGVEVVGSMEIAANGGVPGHAGPSARGTCGVRGLGAGENIGRIAGQVSGPLAVVVTHVSRTAARVNATVLETNGAPLA